MREKMAEAGLVYMADVPSNTKVYEKEPEVGVPARLAGQKGKKFSKLRVISSEKAVEVRDVAKREQTSWTKVWVRPTQRGELAEEFSAREVWTVGEGCRVRREWLVMRRGEDKTVRYALSNAAPDVSLERLAWLKCQRHFVECANQAAKSELGWDELRAQKYQAWEHHLALTILASWFIAETKLDWEREHERDAGLAEEYGQEALPRLSVANVRELLRSAMPLPSLSPETATDLVLSHLVNRARSRRSRLRRAARESAKPPS